MAALVHVQMAVLVGDVCEDVQQYGTLAQNLKTGDIYMKTAIWNSWPEPENRRHEGHMLYMTNIVSPLR